MSSEPPADPWGERLPRRLGLGSAIGLLIANSIGSGIFRVPATVAGALEHTGPILLAWTVGGVLTLCAALSLAEPVAAIPRSGGLFRILHTAYGPVPAFVLGVAEVLVIAPAGLAAVATIFAAYLGHFVALSEDGVRYLAAGGMLSVGVANYFGVRGASAVTNLSTLAKYGGLLLLAGLAFAGARATGDRQRSVARRPLAGGVRRGAGADHVHLRGLGRPLPRCRRSPRSGAQPSRAMGSAWRSW
jgi:amino acid transporter